MGLHYSTRLIVDGEELSVDHYEDILDAGDQLVVLAEQIEADTRLPLGVRKMADKHAASLIRLCYDRILLVGEEHSIQFTQPGAPMVRLVVVRHPDLPGAPTPTLVDNLTGQPA